MCIPPVSLSRRYRQRQFDLSLVDTADVAAEFGTQAFVGVAGAVRDHVQVEAAVGLLPGREAGRATGTPVEFDVEPDGPVVVGRLSPHPHEAVAEFGRRGTRQGSRVLSQQRTAAGPVCRGAQPDRC